MKNYIPKIFLLTTGVMIAAISFPVRNQLRQSPAGASVRDEFPKLLSKHSALPPVARFDEPQAPQDPQEQKRRQSRDRLDGIYKHKVILDPGVREINGEAEGVDLTFIDTVTINKPGEIPDPNGLPISGSLIVIGTVTGGKAYVNQEHTALFSEYRVAVKEVLKPDPDSVVSVPSEISTWRSGGSLQFPSGHITHFLIAGRGFPEVGTQYVFFLRKPNETIKDYAISTAFSIKDQVVSPLDAGQDKDSFDGMRLKDFLTKLRQEISIRREGGND